MPLRKRLAAISLTLALLCLGWQPAAALGLRNNKDRVLTVMTYNLYLGTDFDGIFQAQGPEQLVAEVAAAYARVEAGNPRARLAAIADGIAAADPDLVSLQEVALWQTGAFFDPAPAANTTYDFLQLLP